MPRPIYVIGHKNSDLDAVVSAYAYARLLRMQGEEQAIAVRHGPLTPEVRFVLERFQVDPPEAMDDVYLHVRDIMRRDVICAYLDQPLLEVSQFLQEHNQHAMPVVDNENKVHGIIAIEDFAKLLLNNGNPQAVSRVSLERDNLVRVLRGRVLVEGQRKLGNCVLVGAMEAETMANYIEPGCLVVLGDREDAQLKAIECGAAVLVVTGDFLVSPRTLAAAQQHGVMVISTVHHTFPVGRLIQLSTSTKEIMNRELDACRPEDQMREVQPKLRRHCSLPVVDAEGKLVGYLSRTDLLDAHPKRVILVDQNEQSQAVDGIEEAEVLGIIDHHHTTDIYTNKPSFFYAEPVGSTATMIAGLYHEAGIAIPREAAGLLLAGVLYDTLVLRSLNCTTRDERVAAELAEIANEQIEKFGQELFSAAASDLNSCSAEALLTADLKEFTLNGIKFATSTVKTVSPATIEKRSEELLATMQRLAQERGYTSFLFMIRDIINIRCTLLVFGGERAVAAVLGLPLEKDGHTILVEGLVTRKRQLVPLLPHIVATLKDNTGAL